MRYRGHRAFTFGRAAPQWEDGRKRFGRSLLAVLTTGPCCARLFAIGELPHG